MSTALSEITSAAVRGAADRSSSSRPSVARAAMWAAILGLAAVSAAWVALALVGGAGLTHESGVLIGLAMHARAGRFYPPLLGPDGYGGTRYGPVHVLLQWALLGGGMGPIASGHLLTLAAAAALWAGMTAVLRVPAGAGRNPLAWPAAVGFPLLALASADARYSLAGVRPDLLPAALNVWGLACVARGLRRPPSDRRAGVAAALLFAAAILAKISAGFGIVTAVAAVALAGRPRRAVGLGAVTGGVVAVAAVGINLLSHGRLWESFHACGNAGGRPAVTLARYAATLRQVFLVDGWPDTLLVLVAVAAWAGVPAARRGVVGLYLPVTLALTLPMYVTPGLSVNHLIDVRVAAVLVLATAALAPDRRARAWAAAVAVVAAAAVLPVVQRTSLGKARYRRVDLFRQAVARAGPTAGDGPVLSDNAMVPIAAGRPPFLLDQFMFPSVRVARPDAQADLYRRLDRRFFGAVVLWKDPSQPDQVWTWGPRFRAELTAHYDLVARVDSFDHLWVYRPKPDPR